MTHADFREPDTDGTPEEAAAHVGSVVEPEPAPATPLPAEEADTVVAVPAETGLLDTTPAGYDSGAYEKKESDTERLVDDPDALLRRWQEVQAGFVDDPKATLGQAGGLVQEVLDQVARRFDALRQQDDASTEDMRLAIQRYRAFFQRLLSA